MSDEPEMFTKYPSLRKMMNVPEEEIVESHDGRETALLKYIYNRADLDTKLRGSPSAILAAIDEFAANEDFLINIGSNKAGKLADLIREHQPKLLLELGGYIGYSAILFASVLKESYQSHPDEERVRLYSIEIDPLCASIAMNLVSLAGLTLFVEVIVGSSADTLRRLHKEGTLKDVDLLFVDHVEELYKPDLELCEKLGLLEKTGALVVADNVMRPGAPEYREYVRSSARFGESWALPARIIPGDMEDELEISQVGKVSDSKSGQPKKNSAAKEDGQSEKPSPKRKRTE